MTTIDSPTGPQSGAPITAPSDLDVQGAAQARQTPTTPVDVGEPQGAPAVTVSDSPPPAPSGKVDTLSAQKAAGSMADTAQFNINELIEVMFKLDLESEKANRAAKVSEIMNVAETQQASADDIRSGAALTLAAGVVSGAAQVVGGAVAIGGSVKAARAMSPQASAAESGGSTSASEVATMTDEPALAKSAGTEKAAGLGESASISESGIEDLSEPGAKPTTAGTQTAGTQSVDEGLVVRQEKAAATFVMGQDAQNIAMKYQGISQLVTGSGQIVSSGLTYGATEKQADSKEKDSEATKTQAIEEQEGDYAKSMSDHAAKMYQTLDAIYTSQHQARAAVYS